MKSRRKKDEIRFSLFPSEFHKSKHLSGATESQRYHLPSSPDSKSLENFWMCFSWEATQIQLCMGMCSLLGGERGWTLLVISTETIPSRSTLKVLSLSLKQQFYHSTTCTPSNCALSRSLLGQNTRTYKTTPGSFPTPYSPSCQDFMSISKIHYILFFPGVDFLELKHSFLTQ